MGVNQYSDLSEEEWSNFLTLKSNAEIAPRLLVSDFFGDEEPVDWRKNNAVNKVKDQGNCGSCWAFSAIGALESAYVIDNDLKKPIINFSEQQLVDCDYSCYGCQGGLMKNAFDYFKNNYIVEESDYSYTAARGICKYDGA